MLCVLDWRLLPNPEIGPGNKKRGGLRNYAHLLQVVAGIQPNSFLMHHAFVWPV